MPIFKDRTDYRQVLIREMEAGKIPLSLGVIVRSSASSATSWTIPTERPSIRPRRAMRIGPSSWIISRSNRPTQPSSGALAVMSSWNGPTSFCIPRRWNGSRTFSATDKNLQFFTVGFVHVPKIHQLTAQFPGRINFELSVITLSDYRQRLMPHAPSVNPRPGGVEGARAPIPRPPPPAHRRARLRPGLPGGPPSVEERAPRRERPARKATGPPGRGAGRTGTATAAPEEVAEDQMLEEQPVGDGADGNGHLDAEEPAAVGSRRTEPDPDREALRAERAERKKQQRARQKSRRKHGRSR